MNVHSAEREHTRNPAMSRWVEHDAFRKLAKSCRAGRIRNERSFRGARRSASEREADGAEAHADAGVARRCFGARRDEQEHRRSESEDTCSSEPNAEREPAVLATVQI